MEKPAYCPSRKRSLMGCTVNVKAIKHLHCGHTHPGMRCMNRLATMECKKEDTEMVEIFFRLFNEALANFLGGEGYKFNLTMLCMDEVGANLQGVWNVFGDAFMSRVVSCQWHFMECAQRQLPYIDVNDKTTFMHYVRMICKGQTYAKYKLYSDGLEHICRKNK